MSSSEYCLVVALRLVFAICKVRRDHAVEVQLLLLLDSVVRKPFSIDVHVIAASCQGASLHMVDGFDFYIVTLISVGKLPFQRRTSAITGRIRIEYTGTCILFYSHFV